MDFKCVFDLPIPHTIAGHSFGSVTLDVDGFIRSQSTTNPTVDDALGEDWLKHLFEQALRAKDHISYVSKDPYLMKSLMQKGVRRRDWEAAATGAYNLVAMGQMKEAKRRLHVIALEDVGNGDPDAAALAQMILQSTVVRKELGDVETILMAARVLTFAWKSRDCTDLYLWPEYQKEWFSDELLELKKMPEMGEPELVKLIALDPAHKLKERIAAMMCLSHDEKLEVAREMKVSEAFIYAYEMSAKKSGFSFRHVAPFAALLTQNPKMRGDVWPMFNDRVNGILSAAYDMYTSKGKSAIRVFGAQAEVKKWFADHPHVSKTAIFEAVFYVEGGLISPRVMHDASLDLYYSSLEAMMLKEGFASIEEGLELYELVLQFLPRLNRRRVSTGNDSPHDKGVL